MNIKLIDINAILFLRKYDGSDLKVHLNIHNPGKMNIKTAAKLPNSLMTSPILGITSANTSDRTNHTVTQT